MIHQWKIRPSCHRAAGINKLRKSGEELEELELDLDPSRDCQTGFFVTLLRSRADFSRLLYHRTKIRQTFFFAFTRLIRSFIFMMKIVRLKILRNQEIQIFLSVSDLVPILWSSRDSSSYFVIRIFLEFLNNILETFLLLNYYFTFINNYFTFGIFAFCIVNRLNWIWRKPG